MFHQMIERAVAQAKPTRRSFLKLSAGAGAGLVIGAYIPVPARAQTAAHDSAQLFTPFIQIDRYGVVTVLSKHLDKGQGTASGLATLVAEELDAAHAQMRADFAPANTALYANLLFGMQGTGGSTAIANSFEQYRRAGAAARAMLVQAAAEEWDVAAWEIKVDQGIVSHTTRGREVGFGDLVARAGQLPVPEEVTLKDPSEWVYIGKSFPRVDVPAKSAGSVGLFGMDVQREDMLVAATLRSPKFGGRLVSFQENGAGDLPGVAAIVEVPQGVAVIADKTWTAFKARDMITAEWDFSEAETRGTDQILEEYQALAAGKKGLVFETAGDGAGGLSGADTVIETDYVFPYLAHAAMEPFDITAQIDGDRVTMWFGSQFQTVDQQVAAAIAGVPVENVAIHTTWSGGSFGRRTTPDAHYVAEAISIAKASGISRPIKVVWTREDDMRAGYFRPFYVHKARAGLDADGNLVGWHHRIVGQSILKGSAFEEFLVHNGIDDTSVEGIKGHAYDIPNFHGELVTTDVQVPVLWWRSVGHTHTAYAMETMMELAASAAGADPVAFRRAHIKDSPRRVGVLDKVAEMSNWDGGAPEGRYRGVAVHKSFNTYVAEVAEISLRDNGTIKVEKVWCAVDCGVPVNPDNIVAQMEGGIGYGLSAILREEVTLTEGEVDQTNFDSYTPLRIDDMPEIEVAIIPSAEAPTGVGEPGTPPIGPAVANAVFHATGQMPTVLPLNKAGLA